MKKLYGNVIPMVTPLTEEDEIDITSLENLTDYCIEGGMNCLYPCGTTGEMMYLTMDERKKIAETVVKKAAGRVPVFIHVGAWNQKDTIELAKHAAAIGSDGIGVVTPSFYSISDTGLIDYYTAVAKSVPDDFPVYLYGIKQNAVNDINPYICEEIAKNCPNVIGAKYSFGDMTMIQKLMTVKENSFDVLVGPDHMLTAAYVMGAKGAVPGNAMILREHYKALWESLENGDFNLAAKIQRRTNVLSSIMMDTGKNMAVYKSLLKREGIISTTKMRLPLEQLSKEEEEAIFTQMDALKFKEVIL